MSLRICVNVSRKGGYALVDDRVCFDIPMWVDRYPPPGDPHPESWLSGHGITSQAGHDLQVLASLHVLASRLTHGGKDAVQEAVRAQIGHVNLPEGVEVHF